MPFRRRQVTLFIQNLTIAQHKLGNRQLDEKHLRVKDIIFYISYQISRVLIF